MNQALDMVAEEREAWKARALSHAGMSQAVAILIEDECDADD